jgi:beta-galactosidase
MTSTYDHDRSLTPKIQQMIYGGDYNPEQWPEDVWEEDARLMREAGVNLVSVGIFSWAKLEPREGEYDFGWLDRVIDILHAHGVFVNLATATASPPPWMARRYPDILPVTVDGVTLWHGSRRHYSPHSRVYREKAKALARQLAERYRHHPALAMWHVDNEYACHYSEDFSDAAAAAFREWLRLRHGSIEALDSAWGSAFWGQIYSEWDEIYPPRRAPYIINPSHQLDWKRFCSDSWLACFEDQRAILKELTPEIPVTTNFMGFHKPLDYWAWAAREDLVANDAYPDPSDPGSAVDAAMACDLMRSLGAGRPWVLMEQATSHVNWRRRNAAKSPGQMRATSYQAVARGADGIMFFQWRASQAGGEQFHSAMLPHAGTDSRTWREVSELGAELKTLDTVRGTRVPAQVAMLMDWQSWWALEIEGKPSADLQLAEVGRRFYLPLFERNIAVDFVRPGDDLSRYRLVFAPNLYLVGERAAASIEAFVSNGGTCVISFFSGIVDERGQIYLGGYPAPFRSMLGLRVEEFAAFGERQADGVIYTHDEESFACDLWGESITLEGATAIASFGSEFYANQPAATSNRFGKGTAYYVGTRLDPAGMDWLIDTVCAQAKVAPPVKAPAGVEVVERSAEGRSFLFAINRTGETATIQLPSARKDLLGGGNARKAHKLEPYGVAVLVEK